MAGFLAPWVFSYEYYAAYELHAMKDNMCGNMNELFYGSVTVGERGQIVIPAEARCELDMNPGDKLIVMRHPIHAGLMVFKLEGVRAYLNDFAEQLQRLEQQSADPEAAG